MQKLFTYAIGAMALTAFFSACKKDDDDVKPSTISGNYTAYEMETYTPPQTIQLPTSDGSRGEVIVNVTNDSLANMRILLFDNNTIVLDEQVDCRMVTDSDEGITLQAISDGSRAAYLIEQNEIDVYWIPQTRISARK